MTITFKSASECHRWLRTPQLKYWPQQLNFAVWCATSGCGIPSKCRRSHQRGAARLPKMIQSLFKFHIYFTIRRILYELECPLPGDSIFKQKNNKYNKIALERLINEFGFNNPDFRWRGGKNKGLGTILLGNGRIWKMALIHQYQWIR